MYTINANGGGSGSGGPATTLVAGDDVTLTQGTNAEGGIQYTVNSKQYKVVSGDSNIIITETEV